MSPSGLCPLCGTETDRVLSCDLRRGTGVVFYCPGCDLGFLVADPRDDSAYYAGEYRQGVSHKAQGGATNPKEIFETYQPYQGERLRLVAPHLRKDSAVLEVGASAGQFLSHLEHRCARRCAIELDPSCCEHMTGMGIEADSRLLRDSRFAGEKFELVVAFQTMEHVADPVGFLKDIRAVMARGGIAFVEVPNLRDAMLSVWAVEEFRKFYFHEDHRFYFTAKSLISVSEMAGFQNPRVVFSQDYNVLSTINWIYNRSPWPYCHPGLSRVQLKGGDTHLARWLSTRLNLLNDEYVDFLKSSGTTSDATLVLS